MEDLVPGHVEPTYRPSGNRREIVLYAGDLNVEFGGESRTVRGQLELRLGDGPLAAHFAGPDSEELRFAQDHESTASVAIPTGTSLAPPSVTILPLPESCEWTRWCEARIRIDELAAGEMKLAQHFIFHISGAVDGRAFPVVEVLGGQLQRQLGVSLPDWDLVIAQVSDPDGERDFAFVVQATPIAHTAAALTEADIDALTRRLFYLLSFIASREVGVGPVCGLNEARDVIWAKWSSPRLRLGKPGFAWCPPYLVGKHLPAIANGFAKLSTNAAREAVVCRAIEHLLSANAEAVPLDVRIPVACSGLEMLGWAVLQDDGWLTSDVIKKPSFTAGAQTRLLLRSAGVEAALPIGFDALADRLGGIDTNGSLGWGGPEVLFNVRNKLVHPPNSLDDPVWPSFQELVESWKLATWYLELVILRLLRYEGRYYSRVLFGPDHAGGEETVPWAANRG